MQQPLRSRRSVLVALAGGAASAAFPALGPVAGVPQQVDHPDLPLAAGRLDRSASAHPGRDRRPPPRPDRSSSRTSPAAAARPAPARWRSPPSPTATPSPSSRWACCACRTCRRCSGTRSPTSPSSSASRATPSASRSAPTRPTRPSTSTSRRRARSPGTINYGSTGVGTSPHLLMEELAANAKVQLNHVPFKGNADLQQALLGGHVMAQSDASGWDKFVDGGQMRLLVTFGEKRTKRWPNVPTAQELGYGVVSTSPYGFVGPEGHGPGGGQDAARRLQEGDGRSEAPRAARPAQPGRLVPQRRRLCEVGARDLRPRQGC